MRRNKIMNNYEIVTDFSWEELIADAYAECDPTSQTSFFDVFENDLPTSNFVYKSDRALKDHLEDLFNLLYKRYYDWSCVRLKGAFTAAEEEKAYKRFLLKLNNITAMTYDKYATRLDIFAAKKATLMGQVQAGTIAKTSYNDTPQNESSGGFEDATHRTTFTKVDSQSLTDGATPIERIDEIDRKIKNIMLEWCEEYKQLFWED